MADKIYKPGQYYVLSTGQFTRCAKRTNGCKGCLFEDSIILCPNLALKSSVHNKPNCVLNNIILVKP